MAAAFFEASRNGELQRLKLMLSQDVAIYSDGGGKVSSLERPCKGLAQALDLFGSLRSTFAEEPSNLVRFAFVNGLPGFVSIEKGAFRQTTALQIEEGRIRCIYVMRNPDKLRHVDAG